MNSSTLKTKAKHESKMNESDVNASPDRKFDRIDELCQLLLRQDGPATKWFSVLCESHYGLDPFTSVVFHDEEDKDNLNKALLPQMFHVLHECILNLRWPQVLQIIRMITRKPSGSSHTIWKVGNEFFQREGDERLVKQLFDQMKHLQDLESKEVVLEFVFYLMEQGQYDTALTSIQEHIRINRKERTAKNYYVDKLTRAYTGLLWYIEWKNFQRELQTHKGTSQYSSQDLSQSLGDQIRSMGNQAEKLEMQMINCANKAAQCFQELVGQPGVWDIFVPKHVELLVYQEKVNDALTVVQKYAKLSPDNPNAQKYLYRFYTEHFPSSENTLKPLKVVADLIPSDSLVLELCDKLQAEDPIQACTYLFNLLDYPCWQNDLASWRRLGNLLKTITADESKYKKVLKTVRRCWKHRSSWWPAYHFSEFRLTENMEPELVFHKAVVAGILMGAENTFTTNALQRLNSKMTKDLKNILENT